MNGPHPAYRFYGRRSGKSLRRTQAGLIQDLLPLVRLEPGPLPGPAPHWLEIGFGGGEHLAHQAALNRHVTLIGAEPFLNGVAKLLAEIETRDLTNVRIHHGDARPLLDGLGAGVFERIWLPYPDPWPKSRHHRRRFINAATLASIHRVLAPGGLFIFTSDIADYVDWTLAGVAAHGGFTLSGQGDVPPENWITTRYETKALKAGRTPNYLTFVRTDIRPGNAA